MLLEHFPTAVVPVSIQGSRDALPPGRNLPSFRPVRIIIGKARTTEELMREGCGEKPSERVANALQQSVAQLSLGRTDSAHRAGR
jgi:hypothetical protein